MGGPAAPSGGETGLPRPADGFRGTSGSARPRSAGTRPAGPGASGRFFRPPGGRPRPGGLRRAARVSGYAACCVLAALTLAVSGLSYFAVRDINGIGGSHAITGASPSIGPQNILLMGLESRRDWNGRILPYNILSKLHAGSYRGVVNGVGGNTTNTLILIHIPAGGKKAIGFSIPRDDWVTFAGTVGPQQAGKIDQAYGVSMYFKEQQLRQRYPHMPQDQLAFLGNEAGRRATVATVEKLTGVHVDHFAEVNLAGFYELAKVLGGVNVCLRHPVSDSKSGANFPAGYQHLNAQQALAFVRQRDGLTNGDLDRTHRQQAFIDSVIHQLRTEGVLSDLAKMQALLSVAKRYVITDAGWNLLDFAAQTRYLSGGNLVFRTLPITGYGFVGSQAVNFVKPHYIRSIVRAAFYRAPAPPAGRHSSRATAAAATTVDVLNGGQTARLASRVSAALVKAGYRRGTVGNTAARSGTTVEYGLGTAASARRIAALFGVAATWNPALPHGHVEVLLGASAVLPQIAPSASPPAPAPIPAQGPQGGAVIARNGVPCVN